MGILEKIKDNCTGLECLTIKSDGVLSVDLKFGDDATIKPLAFTGISTLKRLTIRKADGVVNLLSCAAFYGTPIETREGYVYVPARLLKEYAADDRWKNYKLRPLY